MLDKDGYRPNVGIILVNGRNEVFWGKRIREHSWQFPQGGIKRGETPEQAMFRELEEETGLRAEHVHIIGRTRNWLRYNVPENWVRREWRGHYRGQKQIWFLLRMIGRDTDVKLRASSHPEFDAWRWNEYWVPLEAVIEFKREVYQQALTELSRFLMQQRHRDVPRYLRKRRDGHRTGDPAHDGSRPGAPARDGRRSTEAPVPPDGSALSDGPAPLVLTIGQHVTPGPRVEVKVDVEQRLIAALGEPLADRRAAASSDTPPALPTPPAREPPR